MRDKSFFSSHTYKLLVIAFVFVALLLLPWLVANSPSSAFPPSTVAQTNGVSDATKQATTESAQESFEFVRLIGDPCRYYQEGGFENVEGYREFYDMQNAGFPKEVSVQEAVIILNKIRACFDPDKTRQPLQAQEVIASLRKWDCEKDADVLDKTTCADFRRVAETGRIPKGSFFHGSSYRQKCVKGNIVNTSGVALFIRLDQYRYDLKEVPRFAGLYHSPTVTYTKDKCDPRKRLD